MRSAFRFVLSSSEHQQSLCHVLVGELVDDVRHCDVIVQSNAGHPIALPSGDPMEETTSMSDEVDVRNLSS